MYVVNHLRPTRFVYWAFEQSGSALFGAYLLKFVLFDMYNYLISTSFVWCPLAAWCPKRELSSLMG